MTPEQAGKIEAEAYAIIEWAVESKDNDIFKVITKSYIAGRTKGIERERELEDKIEKMWIAFGDFCDSIKELKNPKPNVVFNQSTGETNNQIICTKKDIIG